MAKIIDRREMLDAAARVFRARGYHNATVDELAAAMGVAKPTIYRHWGSKEGILQAIGERVLERVTDLDAEFKRLEGAEDVFWAWVGSFAHIVAEMLELYRVFYTEELALSTATRRRFRAWERQLVDGLAEKIERLDRPGVDPKIAAFIITGMMSAISRWYDPRGATSPQMLAENIVALLSGALAPRSEAAAARAARAAAHGLLGVTPTPEPVAKVPASED